MAFCDIISVHLHWRYLCRSYQGEMHIISHPGEFVAMVFFPLLLSCLYSIENKIGNEFKRCLTQKKWMQKNTCNEEKRKKCGQRTKCLVWKLQNYAIVHFFLLRFSLSSFLVLRCRRCFVDTDLVAFC